MTQNHKFYELEKTTIKPIEIEDQPRYAYRTIRLADGISMCNYFASQIHYVIMIFSFTSGDFLEPLILLDNDFYNINKDYQGTILSFILFVQLLVKISTAIFYGHLCDKFGRRVMMLFGAVSTLIGFILAPMFKEVFPGFVFAKILISNGATALITIPFNADYVHDSSKGKATALQIALSTVGAVLSNLFLKGLLMGKVPLNQCYWITGAVSFVVMVINSFFIKRGKYYLKKEAETDTQTETKVLESRPFTEILREAVGIFKSNAWLFIAFVLQTLGNADFYIVFTILAIYVKSLFPIDTDSNESNIALNNVQTVALLPALFSNAFYGYCIDTKNKLIECIVFSLGGGAMAFIMTFFVGNPYDWELYVASFVLGTTITGVYVISNFLGNKHFPADKRGIMGGVMALIGYIGYVIIASGGGFLFDHWSKNAFFIIYGGLLLIALAIILITYYKKLKYTGL